MIRVISKPRISVNPLCEYVAEASASRRTTIIKQCKVPPTFITKWYNRAEEALATYLAEIRDNPNYITMEVERLRTKSHPDPMEKKYAIASAFALRSFLTKELKIRELLQPFKLRVSIKETFHKLILKGVQISLRPEIMVHDSKGKQQLGFVKLYFGKEPLSEKRGELMACLIKHYFYLEQGLIFKNNHCMVLDVYRGKMHFAPTAYKRRVADLEAACQEIADRWDLL